MRMRELAREAVDTTIVVVSFPLLGILMIVLRLAEAAGNCVAWLRRCGRS